MKEIIFLINEAKEGGYYAEAVGVGIFAEGETIEELKERAELIVTMRIQMMRQISHIFIM
jgi:predicted RNase H-like HicB family nuclease